MITWRDYDCRRDLAVICPECRGEFVVGVEVCPDCKVGLVAPEPDPDPAFAASPRDSFSPDPHGSWVVLHRTGRLLEADLVASTLEEAGLPHYREEQNSGGLSFAMPAAPSAGPGTWWVIQVPEAVVEDARSVIEGLPLELDDSPGIWDFGPTPAGKTVFKGWALLVLVLFAAYFLWGVISFFR